jgi:hypothetical protein
MLLNGKMLSGEKSSYGSFFTTIRYAIILLAAITLDIFEEKEKTPKPKDCTHFNFYRLKQIADVLQPKFDITKVAKKIYKELKNNGELKIESKDNKEYNCLAEKERKIVKRKWKNFLS